jgi:hypothetical protein
MDFVQDSLKVTGRNKTVTGLSYSWSGRETQAEYNIGSRKNQVSEANEFLVLRFSFRVWVDSWCCCIPSTWLRSVKENEL